MYLGDKREICFDSGSLRFTTFLVYIPRYVECRYSVWSRWMMYNIIFVDNNRNSTNVGVDCKACTTPLEYNNM